MLVVIWILLILLLLYLLALWGRGSHPGMAALRGHAYAHRGLHGEGLPENSMAAFRRAVDSGYGIELDLHLLRDGSLAVIHDALLNRTTGQAGRVEDLTAADLARYPLEGTDERIPLFQDVLALVDGKVPLIIELKCVDGNHAALAQTACDMLEGYGGAFCIESFDPRCIRWLRKNRPQIIRGLLAENYFKTRNELPDILRFLLTHDLLNFLIAPDFIAYCFPHRNDTLSNRLCRKLWGIQGVSWTLRNQADYDAAIAEGWLPIFENFRPAEPVKPAEAAELCASDEPASEQ